ncbi:MAG: UDP-N-acetylmuramate dehydrogenase [Solirubrobacteraceae bacterium]
MQEHLHHRPGVGERSGVRLAQLTTLRVGGPARRLLEARCEEALVRAIADADHAGEPVLVIGGGSNLVVGDEGFAGAVVRVATRGVSLTGVGERVRLAVAAGEPWDELVAATVADGLAGIECLSGIPGLVGATPIQNVGAYGQQVADTIASVRAYDRHERRVVKLTGAECAFGYRTSALRRSDRHVVLGVTFELERSPLGHPLRYAELARALGAQPGARLPLADVREAVLRLRRGKGMVLDPSDADSVSAGSFFVNPLLAPDELEALVCRSRERGCGEPPAWPEGEDAVKTSAAWLIERAGFQRGLTDGRVGISAKHTLALVNRGGASTAELLALARRIRDGVQATFGVALAPEPTLVGVEL